MNIESILSYHVAIYSIFTLVIAIILLYASYEDMKNRTIRAFWVVALYLMVSFYSVLSNEIGTQTTYVFLFTFIIFMLIATISMGQFGYGDALVLGALGWYYHDFETLRLFFFIVGAVCIPWAVYWSIIYKRKGLNLLGCKTMLPIDDVQPGMVLASDNFMQGLTTKDIDKLRAQGQVTVSVKQPFPFIPVIFTAFIITIVAQIVI